LVVVAVGAGVYLFFKDRVMDFFQQISFNNSNKLFLSFA